MSDPPEPVTKPSEGRGRLSGSKKMTKPSPTKVKSCLHNSLTKYTKSPSLVSKE